MRVLARIFEHVNVRHVFLVAIIGCLLLLSGVFLSMKLGTSNIRASDVWNSIFHPDSSKKHLIIQTLRLPRALLSALIGANLAVAGALMQGITRNPLASPQIFGINAGASLTVVCAIVFFPFFTSISFVYFAFIGAAIGGFLVFYLGSSSGSQTPVKLALAGTAVSMLLSALTEGIIIFNDTQTQGVLFWMAGSVDGADWKAVYTVLPWSLIGVTAACLLSPSVTILSLGDEIAKGLGQRILLVRIFIAIVVIALAGASVSVAGPIGFVGLVIPHIVRKLVGIDYRFIIPFSALLGGVLMIYADLLSRFISYPYESPVGIVTAAIGAPFFLYLIRKGWDSER